MADLKDRVIITAALTGAMTPAGYQIPETPEQIAEDAYACWKAGAAVVHLHMRDEQGLGTMDVNDSIKRSNSSAPTRTATWLLTAPPPATAVFPAVIQMAMPFGCAT